MLLKREKHPFPEQFELIDFGRLDLPISFAFVAINS